jgi:hypothetical protein
VTVVTVKPAESLPLPLLLFAVFLTLRLCHVITWSWWWVTAPLWVPVAAIPVMLGAVLMVALLPAARGLRR